MPIKWVPQGIYAMNDPGGNFGREGGDDGRGDPGGQLSANAKSDSGGGTDEGTFAALDKCSVDPDGLPIGNRSCMHLTREALNGLPNGYSTEGPTKTRVNPDGSIDVWADKITINGKIVGFRAQPAGSAGSSRTSVGQRDPQK